MISEEKMEMLRQAKKATLAHVRELVGQRHIHGIYEEVKMPGQNWLIEGLKTILQK
jgi:hypothetical protein